MKKKILLLVAGLMLLALLFCACAKDERPELPPEGDTNNTTDNGGSENNSADNYPTSATDLYVVADGTCGYKLYSTLDSVNTVKFQEAFKAKTGAQLSTTTDINEKRLIILGTGNDFAGVEGSDIVGMYTAYQIKTVGDNICVAVANNSISFTTRINEILPKAASAFAANLQKSGVDNWKISKDFNKIVDVATGIEDQLIPEYAGKTYSRLYTYPHDGKTVCQVAYTGETDANTSIVAYGNKLLSLGYTLHNDNELNGNKFATYVNAEKDMSIQLNWFGAKGMFRIIYNEIEYLPAGSPVTGYTKLADASLSQMQLVVGSPGGLSMVAQLEDGSFIIIDGGIKNDTNKAVLMKYLLDNKPAQHAKPQVTWIFTHNHGDHVGNAIDFINTQYTKFDLNLVIYNFPDFETISLSTDIANLTDRNNFIKQANNLYTAISSKFPNALTYCPHAGQELYFPGLEIEMYYTHGEFSADKLRLMNDMCIVFKLIFTTASGEKSCMVFGDSENASSWVGYELYRDALKSDIMQVPHHGAGSASWELYKAVDPSICLWSTEKEKFEGDPRMLGTRAGMEYNAKLRNNAYGVRQHYHQSLVTKINMQTLSVYTYNGATA